MGTVRALFGHCSGTVRALCGHCTGVLYRHRGPHVGDLSKQDPKHIPNTARRRPFRNSSLDSFWLAGHEPSCSRTQRLTQRLMEIILHVRDQRPACHARLGLAQTHTKTPRAPRPQCWYWLPAAFATCKIVSIRAGGGNSAVARAILSPGWGREGHTNLRTGLPG